MLDPVLTDSISYPRVIRIKKKIHIVSRKEIPLVRNAIDQPLCDVLLNLSLTVCLKRDPTISGPSDCYPSLPACPFGERTWALAS